MDGSLYTGRSILRLWCAGSHLMGVLSHCPTDPGIAVYLTAAAWTEAWPPTDRVTRKSVTTVTYWCHRCSMEFGHSVDTLRGALLEIAADPQCSAGDYVLSRWAA